jgi:site-specific recombinase XerD
MAHLTPNLYPDAFKKGFNARFILYKGKLLADKTNPVILQVTKAGATKRYSVAISCTEEQWDGYAMRLKPRVKGASDANRVLDGIAAEVVSILKRLEVNGNLTLAAFDVQYRDPKASGDILSFMRRYAEKLKKEDRIGYAGTFLTAASALGRLSDGKPIRFADVTATKLEELEHLLKANGSNAGGIKAYMRTIRVAINRAIKEGLMGPDQYPFETATHAGYSIAKHKSTAKPRAMDAKDMEKLKHFPFEEHPHLAQSVRYFLFSYYADGMNFKDMARLRQDNLRGGRIFYNREKTGRAINIPVDEVLASIIGSFQHDGPYIFPILGPQHITPQQQWDSIRKCLKRMNADLKKAGQLLGIEIKLTSYVARHTAFSTYYRNGVALEHIAEMARHSSPSVTKHYLGDLGCDVLDEARKKLR